MRYILSNIHKYILNIYVKIKRQFNYTRLIHPFKSFILEELKKNIDKIIEADSSKWSTTYCAKPLFFAYSPKSPMFLTIKEHVIRSLENEINTQADEGYFILNWNIDKKGAIVWQSIWTMDVLTALKKEHWKGILAVNRYKQLMAFNCMK